MSSHLKDYYYILGLSRNASTDEIKKAYRKLSIKFHPDKNDGDKFFEERFKDINEAYETLIDDTKRKLYDDQLNAGKPREEERHYSNTTQNTTAKPAAPKRKRSTLFGILGGLLFLLPFAIRFIVTKANEEEKEKKFNALLHDISTHNTDSTTHNTPDDSVRIIKMYYDSTVSPADTLPVTNREPVHPPGNEENNSYKDDDGQTPIDAVNYFFNAFTNNDCHSAWNTTYNSYWISQGENWFCSAAAFGGVKKVSIRNIFAISQNENTAEVYADYNAEDVYNGNKCFKQTISLQKINYTDDKIRWAITKMKNNEEPVACNENQ